jgi:capsular exopolysaccharide synthesis family protein
VVITTVFFTLVGAAFCLGPKTYQSQSTILLEARTQNSPVPYSYADVAGQNLTNPAATYDIVTLMNGIMSQKVISETWEEAGIQTPQILTDDALDQLPTVKAEQRNQSNAVLLTATGPREKDVRNFLVELPNVYERQLRKQQEEEGSKAMTVIETKLKEEQEDLDKLRKQANEFKSKTNISDATSQAEIASKRVADLEAQSTIAKANADGATSARALAEREYQQIPERIKQPVTELNRDEMQRERTRLNELKAQRDSLIRHYLPEHPEVKAIDAQIASQEQVVKDVPEKITIEREEINPAKAEQRRVVTELRAREQEAVSTAKGVLQALTTARAELPATTANTSTLGDIEKRIHDKEDQIKLLETERQQLSLRMNNIRVPLREMSAASPPKQVKPIVPVYIGLGALVGLILGCFFAISRDNLNDKVASVEVAEYLTRSTLLATIPRRKRSGNPAIDTHLKSMSFESYRLLRTNLLLKMGNTKPKQLLFTSITPGEGVTVVSANLATAFAAAGIKTIYVDANFRRPSGTAMFGLSSNVRGLGEALATSDPAAAFLSDSGTPGLQVLGIGAVPGNIGEALASPRMKSIIDELGTLADVVVYDCAAYQGVADPVALAPWVGKVVLVMVPGLTPRSEVKDFVEMMSVGHVPITGVVMNKTENDRSSD